MKFRFPTGPLIAILLGLSLSQTVNGREVQAPRPGTNHVRSVPGRASGLIIFGIGLVALRSRARSRQRKRG